MAPRKGHIFSKEQRKNMSKARKLWLKTHKHPCLGKKRSKESIDKWRKSLIGFKHSLSTRRKMSLAHKGEVKSEEQKIKQSLAMKGKYTGDKNPFLWKTTS